MGFFSKFFIFLLIFYLVIGPGYNFMMQPKGASFTPQIFNPAPFFSDMKIKTIEAAKSAGGSIAALTMTSDQLAEKLKKDTEKFNTDFANKFNLFDDKSELKTSFDNFFNAKTAINTKQAFEAQTAFNEAEKFMKIAEDTKKELSERQDALEKANKKLEEYEQLKTNAEEKANVLGDLQGKLTTAENKLKILTNTENKDLIEDNSEAKKDLENAQAAVATIRRAYESAKVANTPKEAAKDVTDIENAEEILKKSVEEFGIKKKEYDTWSSWFGRNWFWTIPLGLIGLFLIANFGKFALHGKGFIGNYRERRRAASRGPAAGAGGST